METTPKTPAEVETQRDAAVPTAEPERVQVAAVEAGVSGRVLDSTDTPLESAEVTVTVWTPKLAKYDDAWMLIPDEVIEGATLHSWTSAEGLFRLDSLPASAKELPVVLWVTDPDHLAHAKVFPPGALFDGVQEDLEVHLEPGTPMACEVSRQAEVVSGALVTQRARRTAQTIYPREADLPNPEWVFLRSARTDGAGRVRLAPADQAQEVRASLGEDESAPWQGAARPLVELELVPTFFVEGIAVVDGGRDESWGGLHVELLSRFGSSREPLKRLVVREDGGFGPQRVPLGSFGEAVARFAGGDLVPSETVFAKPTPGERVFLELHASAGNTVYLAAYDPERQVIPSARAFVQWNKNGVIQTREYPTDDDNMITVPGVPDGVVRATLRADGFQDTVVEPFAVPEDPPLAHVAALPRARILKGRCLFEGKPVEDFQVFVWSERLPYQRTTLAVRASRDGSFVCKTAPHDGIAVLACAPGKGVSPVAYLQQSVDYEVELELHAGRQIRGRVLDREGEPLARVHVAAALPDWLQSFQEISAGTTTGPEGDFVLSGVSESSAFVRFERSGFSEEVVDVDQSEEPVTDFGDVVLARSQALRVHADLPVGETRGTVTTFDRVRVPLKALSPSGDAGFDTFRAGIHTFTIEASDLGYGQHVKATLVPGEPWDLKFDLRSGPDLTVKYIGEEELEWATAYLSHYDSYGRWVTTGMSLSGRRQGHVFGVQPGPVQVQLEDRNTGRKAHTQFILGADEESRVVELALSERRTKLHIQDAHGAPVAGLSVNIQLIGIPSYLSIEGTDAEGVVRFFGLDPGPYYASAGGPGGGLVMWAIDVPAEDKQAVELVFDPSHEVAIRFVEQGEPRPGLTGALRFELGGMTFGTQASSDGDGRMRFDKLGLGRYVVTVSAPGLLPFELHAKAGAGELVHEVFSQTDATLRVIHEDGSAAKGVELSLVHQGLGIDLATGLAKGWLSSSTGSLITGPDGSLTLKGLPRGEYAWHTGGGSGTCSVPRSGVDPVMLVLP